MSEARGSGVILDANTTAPASQPEREYFLRLALDLVRNRLSWYRRSRSFAKSAQDDRSGPPLRHPARKKPRDRRLKPILSLPRANELEGRRTGPLSAVTSLLQLRQPR